MIVLFTVVGFKFRGVEPSIVNGGVLTLERDTNNIHDKNAIKLLVNNQFVSYVSREDTVKLIPHLGKKYMIKVREVYNGSVKMLINIKEEKKIDIVFEDDE